VSRQQQRRAGAIFTPAAGPGCDPRKSRPRKTPHGKQATKKRGRRGAGRVYLFFRVKFSGGWNHPPPVLLSSGGWNPSRAILSRVAFTIYPATLSPAHCAAVFTRSYSSGINRVATVLNLDKYLAFPARFASVLILSPLSMKVYHTFFFHAT
jgi:hypothetical protein